MNTFKRKALTAAVLAGLGTAGTANAIWQDPNGLGQFLIYPYYTVNSVDGSAFNTYITVVNPTSFTKVVRFRAREGRASIEVRDFNIYLSPNDVWAAAIIPNDAGGASVVTTDTSCTMPVLPTISAGTPPLKGIAFTNLLYTTGGTDPLALASLGTGLDRLKEGYVEIIELATFDPTTPNGALTVHDPSTDTPPCGNALLEIPSGTNPAIFPEQLPPTGALNGTGTLIHVATGQTLGYNAVALANYTDVPLFGALANDVPNLGNTSPPVSVRVTQSGNLPTIPPGTVATPVNSVQAYRSDWVGGAALGPWQAASATMMHFQVLNEYGLDTATRSNTDWVLTFPTKRGFITTAGATAPFTAKLAATIGACEPVAFTFFNREERGQPVTPGGFSPGGSAGGPGTICWESTILSIRNGAPHVPASGATVSGVLGSNNVTGIDISAGIQNGFGLLTFVGTNAVLGMVSDATSNTVVLPQDGTVATVATGAQTYLGLPVVGFMVRTLQNTSVTCGAVGCKFGGLYNHKWDDIILPQ